MTSIMFLSFLVASCNCATEFSARARNFSIEIMYFTHLEHFVMSPFCVWSVMTGAFFGSYGNTNTQIQRAAVLQKNNTVLLQNLRELTNNLFHTKPNGVEISSMTFLFQDEGINLRSLYKAKVQASHIDSQLRILDFKHTWAINQANNYIQNIFPTIPNVFHSDDFMEASVILSNVIHFRGLLSTPFNASNTFEEIVYNENNVAVGTVSMMQLKAKLPYSNFETLNSNILELPYGNDGKFCMLVIFPYPGLKLIEDVYKKFANTDVKDILTKLEIDFNKNSLQEVDVKMPRFSIRTSIKLNRPLNDMGVYDAFEPDLGKFIAISKESLYIHSVEHKADIIFTESETIAYATTPGYFDNKIFSSNIKVKQPFIFFLMEKPTATILFGGIYSEHRQLNEINSPIYFKDD